MITAPFTSGRTASAWKCEPFCRPGFNLPFQGDGQVGTDIHTLEASHAVFGVFDRQWFVPARVERIRCRKDIHAADFLAVAASLAQV